MPNPKRNYTISPREADVLAGLLLGYSNKRIGSDLGLSDMTIKVHMKAIMRKLKVNTRGEAVTLVMRAALMEPCSRCGHIDLGKTTEETHSPGEQA
jgi:DNA-binding NarL/FixJ family response regulator